MLRCLLTFLIVVFAAFVKGGYGADLGARHPKPTPACMQALQDHVARIQSGNDDIERLIQDLRPIAAAGDPVAQFLVGSQLVAARPEEAVTLLTDSARGGCTGAAAILGMLLMPTKPIEAQTWLARGADGGDTQAQLFLAALYAHGNETTPMNPVVALAWARLAKSQADAGNSFVAEILISQIQATLSEDERIKAEAAFVDLQASHPKQPYFPCGKLMPPPNPAIHPNLAQPPAQGR